MICMIWKLEEIVFPGRRNHEPVNMLACEVFANKVLVKPFNVSYSSS